MKRKGIFLFAVFMFSAILFSAAQSVRTEITAEYGPPEEADTWEHFVIQLTPERFNTDAATFESVMSGVASFWIRTEMHTGDDFGGIDNVSVGSLYASYFHASAEGWSSGGDGTMEWMQTGGYDGGYLQISDWATGDWHWLIAPATWSGDWSSLIGDSIQFWFKTNRPSYSAIVKLTSDTVPRLIIRTTELSNILPNDSLLIDIDVSPASAEEITISFSSSNPACITVPASVTVPAGEPLAQVYFYAAPEATDNCESIIEANAPGYLTSRITLMVDDEAGFNDIRKDKNISIFPNPGNGEFTIASTGAFTINRYILFDITGNALRDMEVNNMELLRVDASELKAGLYFVKVFTDNGVFVSRVLVK